MVKHCMFWFDFQPVAFVTTGHNMGKNGNEPLHHPNSDGLPPKMQDATLEFQQFCRSALHECATHEKLDMLPSYLFLYSVVQTLLSGWDAAMGSSGRWAQDVDVMPSLQLGQLLTGI